MTPSPTSGSALVAQSLHGILPLPLFLPLPPVYTSSLSLSLSPAHSPSLCLKINTLKKKSESLLLDHQLSDYLNVFTPKYEQKVHE